MNSRYVIIFRGSPTQTLRVKFSMPKQNKNSDSTPTQLSVGKIQASDSNDSLRPVKCDAKTNFDPKMYEFAQS